MYQTICSAHSSPRTIRPRQFAPSLNSVQLLFNLFGCVTAQGPVSRKSRKAICEPANRLSRKADLLRCFRGNKKLNDCEVLRLKCAPFLIYKRNCDTRKWPVKFRDFREAGPRPQLFEGWIALLHRINCYPLDNSIAFASVYPVDSVIHVLNNRGKAFND